VALVHFATAATAFSGPSRPDEASLAIFFSPFYLRPFWLRPFWLALASKLSKTHNDESRMNFLHLGDGISENTQLTKFAEFTFHDVRE
jgi:hypothetical protein